jgi:hypothetical protein
VVAAAALGNYPTPLVGYGGAAVLGYLLSVALLPSGARDTSRSLASQSATPLGRGPDDTLSRRGLRPAGSLLVGSVSSR